MTRQPRPLKSLFLCDSQGRMVSRRPDIWSSISKACLTCGTTEKPHEAFGYWRLCYLKFKRQNDPKWREKKNQYQKLCAMRSDARERYDAARKDDPKRKAQRKVISNRYSNKVSKWPIGSRVEYCLVPGMEPITGTIIGKNNACATVQFNTLSMTISFRKLRRVA